ncbi:hypothetical protein [Ruegeria sp.]|uniref:hypothetical protein n=1 Tax=Ruegeria sp. TaxID=1879320 RepID=UPI003B5C0954
MILLLVLLILAGFVTTIIRFVFLLASFSSLIGATSKAGQDRPGEHLLTGGFMSAWRVLRYKENANANWVLARNAVLFLGSFTITMLAAFLLFHFNTEHCVLGMTTTSQDGTVTVICGE